MATAWPEVEQAAAQNRHELVLTGQKIGTRVEENGLDDGIFDLKELNFLEISKCGLTSLPDRIASLNLTNLVLHSNDLTELTPSIGKLSKLKFLDVSRNKLSCLPSEISEMTELYRLNVNGNKITELPFVGNLLNLHELDCSRNLLTSLPEGITSEKLVLLAQINASGNQITEIPSDFPNLVSLRLFDLSENQLTVIPAEMSECGKLKDFRFNANKLKDNRLAKMMEQCKTKSILDYLHKILEKERQSKGGGKGKGKKGKQSKEKMVEEMEELKENFFNVLHFPTDESGMTIQVTSNALTVRPYICCSVVRDLNLEGTSNMFKRFIALQTKLHEGICHKRVAATIATHDLAAVKKPLIYDARKPSEMKLIPLFKQRQVTADRLVAKLRHEADEQRKEKKRNTFSGIHKYLDLVHGKPLYPCLVDNDGVIISFPPITNCDVTKVSKDTKDILIEVTSSTNLDTCKKVLDELLTEMLDMGMSANHAEGDEAAGGANKPKRLVIEQVRILDAEGAMKVVYPSRTDLQGEGFKVVRDYV